jgi:hypothetical protein
MKNTLRIVSLVWLVLLAGESFSQSPWRLSASLGPSLSYNRLSSDRPLPNGKFEAPDRLGAAFDLSAERSLTPNLSIRLGVRTANLKVGTRTSFISRDSTTGAVSGWGRNNGYTQFSPANLNVGFTYNSRLLWRRLILTAGVDGSYIINRFDGYVREKDDRKVDGHWPGDVYRYELVSAHTRNNGLSLAFRTGVDYKLGQYRALTVQLLYNLGFRDLFQISTKELELNGIEYKANVVSKGSYLTLQVGYKQSLRWKRAGNYMSPYNTPVISHRSNRPDFVQGSAMAGLTGVGIPYQSGGSFANLAVRGGYFVADRVLLGAAGFGAYSTIVPIEAPLRGWAVGPMLRYHISTTAFSPFVEASYLMGQESGQTYRRGWQFVAVMPGISFRLTKQLKADLGVYMLRPTYPVSENAVISLPQVGLHYSWR